MNEYGEGAPAYLTFRVTAQPGPIAAFAEEEAWRARERYPQIMGMGLPVFHYTRELDHGGWEILGCGGHAPQDARDLLASYFLRMANACASDDRTKTGALAAAERLDWVALNELRVLGRRYRVVRAEQFIRMGPDGPEPPRPSDPDPARSRPGEANDIPSRTQGFVLDPYTGTGLSDGLLRFDLSQFVRARWAAPDEMYIDARAARRSHPGAVLLPAEFAIAEKSDDGRWLPHSASSSSPQGARDALASHFRVYAPVMDGLSAAEREEYARAADRLDEKRGTGVAVAGRRFRVTRVEQLVRIGPDGPEPPRPSDHDPYPPPAAQVQQLKAEGRWRDEDTEPEPMTAEQRELWRLLEKERDRRRSVRREREERQRRERERGVGRDLGAGLDAALGAEAHRDLGTGFDRDFGTGFDRDLEVDLDRDPDTGLGRDPDTAFGTD
ncbi:DUF5954 family protein [Streptomyces sp. NPDC020965]|uniref:DUF5954 family protein n=1 Tax=Streptomyces sp. NPDC020965 TaxID=3365105 RepID=UPI0037AFFB13